MCITHLFHTTDPCCEQTAMCKAFPSIDWTKATWKVKQPAALWSEVRYPPWGYPGTPLIVFENGDLAAYVGAIPIYESEPSPSDIVEAPVYSSHYGYHMRAGEFVSRYSGNCHWSVYSRERLCPDVFSLLALQQGTRHWEVKYRHFLPVTREWDLYRGTIGPDFDPITGPFVLAYDFAYSGGQEWINWRHVLQAAECQFIPAKLSDGWEVTGGGGSIEGGVIARLEQARQRLADPSQPYYGETRSWYYKPTALDLAVEWTLSGGISFGVESNPVSPSYGQFVIYTGAVVETIETATINIKSTDRTNQQYPTVLTVKLFRQWGNEYLLNESFLSEFYGDSYETPLAFATRIAETLRAAWPYDGPPNLDNHLSVKVVQNGTSVTITTRTIDSSKGGYPLTIGIGQPDINDVLDLMSVSQSSRESLLIEPAPWRLVDRPSVVAEFGVVNRFERTDDNDTLPAWIELELIPI